MCENTAGRMLYGGVRNPSEPVDNCVHKFCGEPCGNSPHFRGRSARLDREYARLSGTEGAAHTISEGPHLDLRRSVRPTCFSTSCSSGRPQTAGIDTEGRATDIHEVCSTSLESIDRSRRTLEILSATGNAAASAGFRPPGWDSSLFSSRITLAQADGLPCPAPLPPLPSCPGAAPDRPGGQRDIGPPAAPSLRQKQGATAESIPDILETDRSGDRSRWLWLLCPGALKGS